MGLKGVATATLETTNASGLLQVFLGWIIRIEAQCMVYLPASSSRDLVWTPKWPFQGLSELHLGNQKVTLKKLVDGGFKHVVYFHAYLGEMIQFD